MMNEYFAQLKNISSRGDAREESYYSALKDFFDQFTKAQGYRNVHVTILPKKTDAGNPDFRIWDGKQKIVGYIEAKFPGSDLDDAEESEQLLRYKNTFKNLILTDFLEFRFYRNGCFIDIVNLADSDDLYLLKKGVILNDIDKFAKLIEQFLSYTFPSLTTSKELAIELAKKTGFLRDYVIEQVLKEEKENGASNVFGFYEAFKRFLIPDLTEEDFANLYSQTITYGLFTSRINSKGEFNRISAVFDIPETIGILRDIFRYISSRELIPQLEWIVDDICDVLINVDDEIFQYSNSEDPIYHFYETFLAEYDPEERERRGVYYTPTQVVSYIISSVDKIIKNKFELNDGLADKDVTILDPAGGTLTFLANAINLALASFISKYGEGGKHQFIEDHILNNFFAFELMIAPYAVGHLKISTLLKKHGYELRKDQRINFYLTNALELEKIEQTRLPGVASLAEENEKAEEVKQKIPILAIIGNPPYSGVSANMDIEWINEKIEDYKYVDGEYFRERKHWLHDDYVKFIRFSEWKINNSGVGILGFITNHSFIDNITFRGMRQHLMNSFNEIYILNLHGSVLRELEFDVDIDENVFDIRQGVSISFFIKYDDSLEDTKVYYDDLIGDREYKYNWLLKNDISSTEWKEIFPKSPYYFFIPRSEENREMYNKFWSITSILEQYLTGVQTSRDNFAISFNLEEMKNKINIFTNNKLGDELVKDKLDINDTGFWEVQNARRELYRINDLDKYYKEICYRPFDIRYIFYHDSIIHRTKKKVMRNMLWDNIAILIPRQLRKEGFKHVFICNRLAEMCVISNKTREQNYAFPLYIYSSNGKQSKYNIKENIITKMRDHYNSNFDPQMLFYYIYAILYSNIYREKYSEFLKTNFARIPITADYELFQYISNIGKDLISFHLLTSDKLEDYLGKFLGIGSDIVQKIEYDELNKRIYINENQYFEKIEKEIWNYEIGSYNVLEKWLNYRNNRKLSLEEIKIFCKTISSLKLTIDQQKIIDEKYLELEKKLIRYEDTNNDITKYF